MVSSDTIKTCEDLIGYSFSDPELLRCALTHASVAPTRLQSNERMEFLGDAVLGLIVCDELYRRAEGMFEGEMTKIKSSVVSRQTCAVMTEDLGLEEVLVLGKGMGRSTGLPTSILAAVLESVIGAIYLDGGLEAAREFVLRAVLPHIEEAIANEHQQNYKSLLQQHAQRLWGGTPEYQLMDEKGPDHSKCFEIAVTVEHRTLASAWGPSKKEAEQEAARRALIEIGVLEPDEDAEAY